MGNNAGVVFFQPTRADRQSPAVRVGDELGVFGAGGRLRDGFARANRPETRDAYRAMALVDDVREAAARPGTPAEPDGAAQSGGATRAIPDDAPRRPAPPVGVWRVRREHPHERRVLADSSDRRAWLEARSRGVTATDAAKLASADSVRQVVIDKLRGSSFGGNAYTDFGRAREPHIAAWVERRHAIAPSGLLFHAEGSTRHLATPDGLACDDDGRVTLAEIKTTKKPWSRIPRPYLRQVWWQQHVLGAERTLFVWERHRDFVVVDEEPRFVWIERDEEQIAKLAMLAELVLEGADRMRAKLEPPF